jgi:O-antigen ligase
MSATAALFVLLFIAGCVQALARHPVFGVMTYVLVFYVSPSDRWWGQGALHGMRWALIAAVVTAVAIVVHRPPRPAIPMSRQPVMWGFAALIGWIALQSFWALDPEAHAETLSYYAKYVVAMYLIYRSLDSEPSIRRFMWAHVAGCTYLAWLAFSSHEGGRFDAFGGAGIGDANSGALTIVTGVLAAASLFFAGSRKARLAIVAAMPLLINAVVATISRSGFLAFGVGGLIYNIFAPRRYAKWIRILSLVGVAVFLALTNPDYWERIRSLQYQGAQVEGVDTGSKRLLLIQAQMEMARSHPLGCGSRCTDALSPDYLDPRQLAGAPGEDPSRSSHNTFMTMLVDHGIPGAVAYSLMIVWMLLSLWRLRTRSRGEDDFMAQVLPAVAGALIVITVGDLFVQYPKLEVRFWFLTVLMTMLSMASVRRTQTSEVATEFPGRLHDDEVDRRVA